MTPRALGDVAGPGAGMSRRAVERPSRPRASRAWTCAETVMTSVSSVERPTHEPDGPSKIGDQGRTRARLSCVVPWRLEPEARDSREPRVLARACRGQSVEAAIERGAVDFYRRLGPPRWPCVPCRRRAPSRPAAPPPTASMAPAPFGKEHESRVGELVGSRSARWRAVESVRRVQEEACRTIDDGDCDRVVASSEPCVLVCSLRSRSCWWRQLPSRRRPSPRRYRSSIASLMAVRTRARSCRRSALGRVARSSWTERRTRGGSSSTSGVSGVATAADSSSRPEENARRATSRARAAKTSSMRSSSSRRSRSIRAGLSRRWRLRRRRHPRSLRRPQRRRRHCLRLLRHRLRPFHAAPPLRWSDSRPLGRHGTCRSDRAASRRPASPSPR